MQAEDRSCFKAAKAVFNAPAKVDGRCFLKVFGRAGDLTDPEFGKNCLGKELVIKNKIIRILLVL